VFDYLSCKRPFVLDWTEGVTLRGYNCVFTPEIVKI
jgi:hypothetical protein